MGNFFWSALASLDAGTLFVRLGDPGVDFPSFVLGEVLVEIGKSGSGQDRVDPDVLVGVVAGHGTGKSEHSGLRGVIQSHPGPPHDAIGGGDVHYGAAAAASHQGDEVLGDEADTNQVHGCDVVPGFQRRFGHWSP